MDLTCCCRFNSRLLISRFDPSPKTAKPALHLGSSCRCCAARLHRAYSLDWAGMVQRPFYMPHWSIYTHRLRHLPRHPFSNIDLLELDGMPGLARLPLTRFHRHCEVDLLAWPGRCTLL